MRLAPACLAVVLALLLPHQPATAGKSKRPAPAPTLESSEHILRFIDGYRAKPEPNRLAEAVRAMVRLGAFKDLDAAGVHLGFMGGVLGANPDKAEALASAMFPMPPEDQVAIVKAIAYSGLPEWKKLLGGFVERMPARRILIDRYLQGKLAPLESLGLETGPAVLDANWGYYFATGSAAPIKRIIGALAWANDKDNVEKLTVAGMAKWTLARNATRDADLLAILKDAAATEKKDIAREVREVIEAVETFETGKLRKDAIALIDDVKQKGPASRRSTAWWAQAGTTAIALGCVAASALGQVEFGIPCIIGGPLSQAATRLLVPQ